jgi:hypothetical protein
MLRSPTSESIGTRSGDEVPAEFKPTTIDERYLWLSSMTSESTQVRRASYSTDSHGGQFTVGSLLVHIRLKSGSHSVHNPDSDPQNRANGNGQLEIQFTLEPRFPLMIP